MTRTTVVLCNHADLHAFFHLPSFAATAYFNILTTSQGADLQKSGAPGRARWSTRSLQQWVMGLSEKGFRVLGHPKAVHGHREDAFCSTIKFTIVKHLGANVFRSQPTSRFEK